MTRQLARPATIRRARVLDSGSPSGLSEPVDISIADGRIAGMAPTDESSPSGGSDGPVLEAHGMLAFPGLVNAHFHSSGTFNEGLIGTLPLELFMLYELPPFDFGPFSPEVYEVQALLAGTRMLRTGTTSVMDDVIFYPDVTADALDAVMRAYERLGMRATVAVYQPNKVEYSWYPYLKELLPDDVVGRMDSEPHPTTADLLGRCDEFVRRWHGAAGDRLRCAVSCSAPQRCSDEYLVAMHDFARAGGLPFTLHLYESKLQRVATDLLYAESAVRHLVRLGVLDELAVLVHAVWIDGADVADIAAAGASIVHSPSGNLRCGSGVFPFRSARRAGIPVALCTDEATVEESCSLWRVAQLTSMLHTVAHPDHRAWPSPAEVLAAMTTAGAAAMQRDGDIGVLEPGALADIVLIDVGPEPFPPAAKLMNHLVHAEDGRSVRVVMVDGEVVVEGGVVLTVDERRLEARAGELMEQWLEAVRPAAAWAERLGPAFEAMYRRCARTDVGVNRWVGDEGTWLADADWQAEWGSE